MDRVAGTHEAQQAPLRGGATARVSLFAVALMWTLPFLQPRHFLPSPTFYSEWLAFALGLAALTLLAGRRAWSEGGFPSVACAPLALGAVILLQAAAGRVPYAGQAVGATLYLVWAAALVVLGAELKRRLPLPTVAAVLAASLVCGGLLTAAAGIAQQYGVEGRYAPLVWQGVGEAHGNLAQRNHYADYLCLGLAAAAYLHATGRMRGGLATLVGAVLVFGLGLSASRAAWLYLALMLLVALHFRRRAPGVESMRLLRYTAWAAAAYAAGQVVATMLGTHQTSVERFASAAGVGARLQIAGSGLAMFLQSPLFGTGWGTYAGLDFERRAGLVTPVALGVTDNAHNLLLHLLAETGLCGALIAAAAATVWLRDARRARRTAEWSWIAMLAGILALHSMLEFPLWQSYFLGVAAVAMGLGVRSHLGLPLAGVAPAGFAAILAVGGANAVAAVHASGQLEKLSAVGRPELPARLEELLALADREIVFRPLVEVVVANRMPIDADFVAEKLAVNERVMRFFPAPMVVYRHAVLLALGGQHDGAVALFARAARVYPGALAEVVPSLERLRAAYPRQIAPLLELASAKIPSPAVTAP